MRFLIIRNGDAETEAGTMPGPELLSAMGRYNEELIEAGVMLDGAGLKATSQGTRVRLAGGKFSITDGPFTEAKEIVAGFSIWKVESRENAEAWIRKWPELDGNGEVSLSLHELYEASDFGADTADIPAPAQPARKPGTTRYLIMYRADAYTESGVVTTEGKETVAAMDELMGELGRSGALLGGEGLKPSKKAARVKFSRGKPTITDGPFTESKELIAGYILIQGSRQDAIDVAKRWLVIHVEGCGVDQGEIEIRPLFEMEDFG